MRVSRDRQIESCSATQASSPESEFERVCRALGQIGERGSFVKADLKGRRKNKYAVSGVIIPTRSIDKMG